MASRNVGKRVGRGSKGGMKYAIALMLYLSLSAAAVNAAPPGAAYAGPGILDLRSPPVQQSLERTARASQALDAAIKDLTAARSAYAFAGFDYERLLKDLSTAREALDPMLLIEERRLRYQTLVPTATYIRQSPATLSTPE